jgi:WD40 repeat protein
MASWSRFIVCGCSVSFFWNWSTASKEAPEDRDVSRENKLYIQSTHSSRAPTKVAWIRINVAWFCCTTAIVRFRSIAPRVGQARLEHAGSFVSAAVSRDGRLIATGSEDMLVRIWKAPVPQR